VLAATFGAEVLATFVAVDILAGVAATTGVAVASYGGGG